MVEWYVVMTVALLMEGGGVFLLLKPILHLNLNRYEQVKSNFKVEEAFHIGMNNGNFNPNKIIRQKDLQLLRVVVTRTIYEIYQDAQNNKNYAYFGFVFIIIGYFLMIAAIMIQVFL